MRYTPPGFGYVASNGLIITSCNENKLRVDGFSSVKHKFEERVLLLQLGYIWL